MSERFRIRSFRRLPPYPSPIRWLLRPDCGLVLHEAQTCPHVFIRLLIISHRLRRRITTTMTPMRHRSTCRRRHEAGNVNRITGHRFRATPPKNCGPPIDSYSASHSLCIFSPFLKEEITPPPIRCTIIRDLCQSVDQDPQI